MLSVLIEDYIVGSGLLTTGSEGFEGAVVVGVFPPAGKPVFPLLVIGDPVEFLSFELVPDTLVDDPAFFVGLVCVVGVVVFAFPVVLSVLVGALVVFVLALPPTLVFDAGFLPSFLADILNSNGIYIQRVETQCPFI